MGEEIKAERVKHKFACGNDLTNLTVINFIGPGGSKASAYCCNMNVDLDGDPQAYAPLSKPGLRPMDNLGNAGWKGSADNAGLKAKYEAAKKALEELEQKKTDLGGKTTAIPGPSAPGPTTSASASKKAPADPAMAALDKQIAEKKLHVRAMSFEHIDANGNHSAKNPKNFEKIFWKWYGVVALTPEDAKAAAPYLEMAAPSLTLRRPVLDESSQYEDVFGRFPVVQSIFEPGPEYYVTPLPRAKNTRYPAWDQRYFLPHDALEQEAFGALAVPLRQVTGLNLNDTVFAMRLDTDDTLAFPFRDVGFGYKVAECSLAAFTGMGGDYHPEKKGAAKFPNNFLNLYLAFPGGQTPASTLAKFATATNASDFPVMLAFIAQATVDAQGKHSKVVGGDPLTAYEAWKKSSSTVKPSSYDVIIQGLSSAGSDFAQRMMQKHASLLAKGPFLQPPTKP
jgi:hypothetical protein